MSLTLAAERDDIAAWPVNFSPAVRAEIIARDTPPDCGRPLCTVCGEPVSGRVVHVHHVLPARHGGRGRYSNGIVAHGEEQAGGCHIRRIHKQGTVARANGWLRSQYAAKPGVYSSPVNCWWRNPDGQARKADVPYWIVLLDLPGDDGLYWRPAYPEPA